MIWAELAEIYDRHPLLARFRPSCECCSAVIIANHYGGSLAVEAWPRVKELREELAELSVV